MEKIKLLKPNEAKGEIAEIFEDIRQTKGAHYLTPTWGFWALVPEVLQGWWSITKKLQMGEGAVHRRLLNSISLICAKGVDCPRCINNHQTHLMEHFGMDADDVEEVLDYKNSTKVSDADKAVLTFAEKVAFGIQVTDEEFNALREHGYDDAGICEITAMALSESSMARHAVVVARFEDGENWPRENVPTKFYGENVDK